MPRATTKSGVTS